MHTASAQSSRPRQPDRIAKLWRMCRLRGRGRGAHLRRSPHPERVAEVTGSLLQVACRRWAERACRYVSNMFPSELTHCREVFVRNCSDCVVMLPKSVAGSSVALRGYPRWQFGQGSNEGDRLRERGAQPLLHRSAAPGTLGAVTQTCTTRPGDQKQPPRHGRRQREAAVRGPPAAGLLLCCCNTLLHVSCR